MAEKHHGGPNQPAGSERPRRRWLTAALLLAVTVSFYWRITLTDQYTWLDGSDLVRQVLPWFQFQVGEIQQGRLPLWDPHQFGGQSLIGQAQPGTAYPLNWLLFILPTRHGWMRPDVLNGYFVAIHFMAVCFAFWLCRDIGLSRAASFLGGIMFGLGGFMGHIDWPQMLNGAVWAPLVLMFLLRVLNETNPWGSAAMGGLCLGAAFLSGHHQIPIFLSLMSAAVWIWAVAGNHSRIRQAALFFAIAAMAGALQTLPAWEYSRDAVRWVGASEPIGHTDVIPHTVHEQFSLKSYMLLGLVLPGVDAQASLYIGATATMLVVLGVVFGWRERAVRVAAGLVVGGVLFALAGDVLLHGVIYSVIPLVEKARSPAMAVVVANLGLAVLAAVSLDRIPENWHSIWIDHARKAVVGFGGFTYGALLLYYILNKGNWVADTRVAVTALIALLATACLVAWRGGALSGRAATALLTLAVLVELGNGVVTYMPNRDQGFKLLPALAQDKATVEALRAFGPGYRVQIPTEKILHNFGEWNGIDVWEGYVASMPRNIRELDLYQDRTRLLYGVRYNIAGGPTRGWSKEVAPAWPDLKIYENDNAFPRAWTVHEVQAISDTRQANGIVTDPGWDLRNRAFVTAAAAPSLERCQGDRVHLLRRESDRVRLWVEMECRGMVVVSDNYAPGWQATVDGQRAQILPAYHALRGVVVDRGIHLIEMRYRPRSVLSGFLLSVVGMTAAIVIWRRERKTR